MRFRAFVGVLAGVSCLAGEPALAADNEIVLEPSSAWAMNYDDDSCALQRLFGQPGNRVLLEFRRFSPASRMQISVSSDTIRQGSSRLEYRFDPDGEWQAPDPYFSIRLGKDFKGFTFSGSIVPDTDDDKTLQPSLNSSDKLFVAQAFLRASGFSLTGGFRRSIRLNTGPLLPAHQAMEACLDELLTHWGIDAQAHKSLTRNAALANPERASRGIVYPASMVAAGRPGLIHFRLAISETGTATACHIQQGISDPAFERSACDDLKDKKFIPALDKNGRPIASYYVNAITYHIG